MNLIPILFITYFQKIFSKMFSKCSNLLNGKFFYVTEESITTFNEEIEGDLWITSLEQSQKLNINNDEELELLRFAQYLDDLSYNIIAIKHFLLFMNTEGSLFCTFELSQLSGYHISLVPFKCEEENSILKCYYFIAVINSDKNIEIYEYRATPIKDYCNNELINKIIYTPENSKKK